MGTLPNQKLAGGVEICMQYLLRWCWLNYLYLRTLPVILNDNNNTKGAAPPAAPPPPPPADLGDSMDSQPDFSFNLELSRNQHEQYGTQFDGSAPAVTIVGKYCTTCGGRITRHRTVVGIAPIVLLGHVIGVYSRQLSITQSK